MLVPHIALTLSRSQDHATLSAVHKLIETFVKQANNKNGKTLPVSYITGNKLVYIPIKALIIITEVWILNSTHYHYNLLFIMIIISLVL